MNTRFKITLSSELPIFIPDCYLGFPDPDYMQNNLCIMEKGNPTNAILINNNILREALLDNRDFCLKYLGLKIYDQSENPEKVVEKIVTRKVTSKETKTKVDSPNYITIDDELIKKYPSLKNKKGKQIDVSLLETFKEE